MKKHIFMREKVPSKFLPLFELIDNYVVYSNVAVTLDFDGDLCVQYSRWETDAEYQSRLKKEGDIDGIQKAKKEHAFGVYQKLKEEYGFE